MADLENIRITAGPNHVQLALEFRAPKHHNNLPPAFQASACNHRRKAAVDRVALVEVNPSQVGKDCRGMRTADFVEIGQSIQDEP